MASIHGYDSDRDAWSRDASERLLPPLLRTCFDARDIVWAWSTDDGWMRRLDTHYGVDAMLRCARRNVALAVRIRARSAAKYANVTVRYRSLQTVGKVLETEKAIARFYFYGVADTEKSRPPSRLVEWVIVDLQRLLDYWIRGDIPFTLGKNIDPSATFLCFKYGDLQDRLLLYKSSQAAQVAILV